MKNKVYKKIEQYWSSTTANIATVLNGFPELNEPDINFSRKLLEFIVNEGLVANTNFALDCACGIGRVTKYVLSDYFKNIDLFEQEKNFVNYIKENLSLSRSEFNVLQASIQEYEMKKKYDLIWVQWCLENVSEADVKKFMKKCFHGLNDDGIIVVKENCVRKGRKLEINEMTLAKERPAQTYKKIFRKTGFKIIKTGFNEDWPKDFIPLTYFLLKKKI